MRDIITLVWPGHLSPVPVTLTRARCRPSRSIHPRPSFLGRSSNSLNKLRPVLTILDCQINIMHVNFPQPFLEIIPAPRGAHTLTHTHTQSHIRCSRSAENQDLIQKSTDTSVSIYFHLIIHV